MIASRFYNSIRASALTCIVRSVEKSASRTIYTSQFSRSAEPAAIPTAEGEKKVYAQNIEKIANDISQLTLLEVADLNSLLKEKLNIPDAAPMAMMSGGMMAAPKSEEEDEVQVAAEVQTSFAVKLTGFEDSKKMGLIRFIKENMEGFNLVQSKKFLEALPAQVKSDLGKDEAEKLKSDLVALGATAEIE